MSDTVFVFGAGCSFDAGIPLLKDFVQTMWEIAIKGKSDDYFLSDTDKEIFSNAIKVRDEIDSYHGRANFDDRNIEDILSILSFNLYEGKKIDRDRLAYIIKAIERTIEITCSVKHSGVFGKQEKHGSEIYRQFWRSIFFNNSFTTEIPTIITFNYDLVLERSLFQVLNGLIDNDNEPSIIDNQINIKYFYDFIEGVSFKLENAKYRNFLSEWDDGIKLVECAYNSQQGSTIELLKLHGSLNFPNTKNNIESIVKNAESPFILPPVYNKTNTTKGKGIWKVALERLRNAKNIVFVGYSLPQTDIYMQYFLKSSLGPNINLNKLFVFDPVIGRDQQKGNNLKDRFRKCFNEQFYNRIDFIPNSFGSARDQGTFSHFTTILEKDPSYILF